MIHYLSKPKFPKLLIYSFIDLRSSKLLGKKDAKNNNKKILIHYPARKILLIN